MSYQKQGFTLIELLVVIAIIGTLASVVLASLNSARDKAKVSKAQAEINQINVALELMHNDIGTYVGGAVNSLCENTNQTVLTAAYLAGNTWMPNLGNDPWDNPYVIDGSYRCGTDTLGCLGVTDASAVSAVIQSYGPNGTQDFNGDDVVYVWCKR